MEGGRETDGKGWVGFEDGWAVGVEMGSLSEKQALCCQEEPELVVSGVCEEGEEG